MIILDNWEFIKENISSIIVLEIIKNNNTDEAKAWTRKYFKEASVVKIFSFLDIIGMKDRRLVSNPIHAPSQELEEIVIKIPLIKVVKKRILVELLDIREERPFLYKWGMNPLALFSLLF